VVLSLCLLLVVVQLRLLLPLFVVANEEAAVWAVRRLGRRRRPPSSG
jgi:hypothetical protein